jgi:hypothetical protein
MLKFEIVPLQVYNLPLKVSIALNYFNEIDVEIVMKECTHLLQFFISQLCFNLLLFPYGKKLAIFKALRFWARDFIVTNCSITIYV